MNEKDIKTIKKIIEHCDNVNVFSKGLKSIEDFQTNKKDNSAILFELLQIGELVSNLSKELIGSYKDIPWNDIYNMRNRIVHGYKDVDYRIIWDSVIGDIPDLKKRLKKMINY